MPGGLFRLEKNHPKTGDDGMDRPLCYASIIIEILTPRCYAPAMRWGPLRLVLGSMMLLAAQELQADPLNQWVWRYPDPQGSTLSGVTYGGGQFVAVGDNGTIISSPDGYNWTLQSSGVFPHLSAVAYAAGEYAAVGDGGIILVSSNLASWTQMPSVTGNSLHSIAGDSNWSTDGRPQFIAVGDSGTAVKCLNGTNWSAISSQTTNNLYSISETSSEYIAVGNAGTVSIYSVGSFQPVSPASVKTTNDLYGVVLTGGGVVVAVGDLNPPNYSSNSVLRSIANGRSAAWALLPVPNLWFPSSEFILHGVATGSNGFVAVGETGYTLEYNYPGVVVTSPTGLQWSELPSPTSENRLYGCAYGNGLYVLVGDAGAIMVSSDLTNWTEVTGYHRSAITAIACDTNLCIASGKPMSRSYVDLRFPDFSTLVSTNGINWAISTVNLPTMADLTVGGGQFVGVNGAGIYTTSDGYNWQTNVSFTNALRGVRYLNGRFVAVGDNGSIFTSLDATNWTNDSVATSGSLWGVAYGNGLYVADGSVAATSPDGVAWTLCPSNPPAFITRIVYGEGQFVAAAYTGSYYYPTGEVMSSRDGTNWQVQFNAPSFAALTGLAYNGGTFLAIAAEYGSQSGLMYKSSDGTNWTQIGFQLPLVDNNIFDTYYNLDSLSLSYLGTYTTLCPFNGTFLAAGLDGIMMQSGNTWNPPLLTTPQSTSNGFNFSYKQQVDVPYRIQSSSNLLDWVNVYSGTGTGQLTNFTWSAPGNSPAQFFRIVSP